ncbi:unnamed protein product [Protopolystoma xenopodis]|uniref:Ig-like domain-containing protein n=1 Tax=Protopolystoma xenopodis TaxID=117903 RepID=A0A3S5AYQ6_9PLAT|nr:unnamed protein product [Protopolystoma xenopodis]
MVIWTKEGLAYPLTIGISRLTPDSRVQIYHEESTGNFNKDSGTEQNSYPNAGINGGKSLPTTAWQLNINLAELGDSGLYTCTTTEPTTPSVPLLDKEKEIEKYGIHVESTNGVDFMEKEREQADGNHMHDLAKAEEISQLDSMLKSESKYSFIDRN